MSLASFYLRKGLYMFEVFNYMFSSIVYFLDNLAIYIADLISVDLTDFNILFFDKSINLLQFIALSLFILITLFIFKWTFKFVNWLLSFMDIGKK